jgi:hypothetical protein
MASNRDLLNFQGQSMIRRSPAATQHAAPSDRWALVGVLALWAGMVGTALGLIAIYGRNVPWREDWYMVPPLVGKEGNLLEWLWAPVMEHRLPFPKAIYLVLLKVSGGDFRIGMLANVLMLGGLCLAMLLMARYLRGGETRLADAFFPLVLVHPGHMENMIFGWQIAFVVPTVLVCMWLLIIVSDRWPLSRAVTAGLMLVLLPLSAAIGLIFTPFVAFWLAAGTLLHRRNMSARWIAPFQIACVLVSVVTVGLYFASPSPGSPPINPGVEPTIVTAVRFIGMGLGPVGAGTGRIFPQLLIGVIFCGVGVLLWASGVAVLRRGLLMVGPRERFRAFGFLIFAVAMTVLVLMLAWSRAGLVPIYGMPGRYALLSLPGLCAIYFAWILYGPKTARDRVAIAFAIAALLALPFNIRWGLGYIEVYQTYSILAQAFEQDLADGLTWPALEEKHKQFVFGWGGGGWWGDNMSEGFQMLHEAKIGPFGRAAPRDR